MVLFWLLFVFGRCMVFCFLVFVVCCLRSVFLVGAFVSWLWFWVLVAAWFFCDARLVRWMSFG